MKTFTTFALALFGLATLAPVGHTQAPAPSSTEQVRSMKDANARLLQQQAATLQNLDELLKNAQQLRIFARRT